MNKILKLLAELAEREARTGLRGLQEFAPVEYLDDYARRLGGGSRMAEMITVDPRQVDELGRAYEALPELDELILPSYRAMAEGTERQFDDLTRPIRRGGMGVDVSVSDVDPFDVTTPEGLREMLEQLQDRRFTVLSTRSTGGHPVFSDAENDMFRAVHDAFGHGATGRGFGRHGEEAAYRAHSAMYPEAARAALAAELRGQNAALNLRGQFGPQLAGFVPEKFTRDLPYGVDEEAQAMAIMDALDRLRASGRY